MPRAVGLSAPTSTCDFSNGGQVVGRCAPSAGWLWSLRWNSARVGAVPLSTSTAPHVDESVKSSSMKENLRYRRAAVVGSCSSRPAAAWLFVVRVVEIGIAG